MTTGMVISIIGWGTVLLSIATLVIASIFPTGKKKNSKKAETKEKGKENPTDQDLSDELDLEKEYTDEDLFNALDGLIGDLSPRPPSIFSIIAGILGVCGILIGLVIAFIGFIFQFVGYIS